MGFEPTPKSWAITCPRPWPLRQDSDAEQSLRMLYKCLRCVRARVKASRRLPWSKFNVSCGACDHLRPKVAKSQIPAPPVHGSPDTNYEAVFWNLMQSVNILTPNSCILGLQILDFKKLSVAPYFGRGVPYRMFEWHWSNLHCMRKNHCSPPFFI